MNLEFHTRILNELSKKAQAKFVVLEHLTGPNKGLRFWSTNSKNNTHSFDNELWYKEIAFTNSTQEAIQLSQKINGNSVTI